MNQEQENAIKLLIQVARVAQKTGVLTLEDAVQVFSAIKCLEIPTAEPVPSTYNAAMGGDVPSVETVS